MLKLILKFSLIYFPRRYIASLPVYTHPHAYLMESLSYSIQTMLQRRDTWRCSALGNYVREHFLTSPLLLQEELKAVEDIWLGSTAMRAHRSCPPISMCSHCPSTPACLVHGDHPTHRDIIHILKKCTFTGCSRNEL